MCAADVEVDGAFFLKNALRFKWDPQSSLVRTVSRGLGPGKVLNLGGSRRPPSLPSICISSPIRRKRISGPIPLFPSGAMGDALLTDRADQKMSQKTGEIAAFVPEKRDGGTGNMLLLAAHGLCCEPSVATLLSAEQSLNAFPVPGCKWECH